MTQSSETVEIQVDGTPVKGTAGHTLASTLANAGVHVLRASVTGEQRGALCAMGVCQECRVTVDGVPHRRACMITIVDGMRVERPGI
jgi:predicted molibdopterin-dependent oxidoreductase YjgC